MSWPLIMDVVVAGLLVATIAFALQLSRRLAMLKNDRTHLQDLVKGLQKATMQAEDAVGGLKASTADAGKSLHQSIERADLLKADLAFITEKAEAAADRLEAALRMQRDAAPAPISIPVEPSPRPRPRAEKQPEAETAGMHSRLASLLKQADSGAARPEPMNEPVRGRPAAEAPMPRPTVVPPRPAAVEPDERAAVQSRAERDLMRALETRR
ncbi:MAG TPA: DUF6468 domain-containing protein [Aliidongia sp.]|nr:DUF6468 domain-containing protein [Aliidongia sp.]